MVDNTLAEAVESLLKGDLNGCLILPPGDQGEIEWEARHDESELEERSEEEEP